MSRAQSFVRSITSNLKCQAQQQRVKGVNSISTSTSKSKEIVQWPTMNIKSLQKTSLSMLSPAHLQNQIMCRNHYSSSSSTVPNNSSCSKTKGTGNFTINLPVNKSHARNVATSQRVIEVTSTRRRMTETKLLTAEERRDFNAIFPTLVDDLTAAPHLRDMPDTCRWLKRVLEYNVADGKKNRGLATALAYRYFSRELTEDNIHLSYVVGWCVELLQAFFLVADDIMDASETRRGKPCWYHVNNMGPTAFNDAILLENSIYPLLKKYFGTKDYYVDLVDLFHDITLKTSFGQSLDTRTGLEKKMETYTYERYSSIIKYKTSYYSFSLPVFIAMSMAGIRDPELKSQAEAITLEMGHFFQVQDDYLDCFGDVDVTGKIGTDIQDAKCSWLIVVALQEATAEQRQLLLDNYGKHDPEKVELVKQIYIDIGLPQMYVAYEEETYNLISSHIEQVSAGLPKKLFLDMLDKIYRRSS